MTQAEQRALIATLVKSEIEPALVGYWEGMLATVDAALKKIADQVRAETVRAVIELREEVLADCRRRLAVEIEAIKNPADWVGRA
jgi:hypothetical protein